jgi:hypothetical protein
MDWNCTLTEERLSDYLEAQLGVTESAALAGHCESCPRCAQLVAQVGGLLAEIHRLEALQEPQNLQARILEATLGPRAKKQGWRRWFAWTPAIWQPRFAIGMATVAVCALVVIQAGGVLPTKMHKANLNPADIVRSMTRQAHLTYGKGVKFVNNLRVVYEIESRLETQNPQPQAPAQPEQNNLPQNRNTPQEKSDKRPGRSESRNAIYYAESAPSPADSTAEQATSAPESSAQPDAIESQQTSETQPDRSATRNNPQLARVVTGDPNLNRGFPAVIDEPTPAVASVAADGLAADGPTKPEWSAP